MSGHEFFEATVIMFSQGVVGSCWFMAQVAEIPEVMVFSHLIILIVSQPQHSQVPDLKKRTNTTFFSVQTQVLSPKSIKKQQVSYCWSDHKPPQINCWFISCLYHLKPPIKMANLGMPSASLPILIA